MIFPSVISKDSRITRSESDIRAGLCLLTLCILLFGATSVFPAKRDLRRGELGAARGQTDPNNRVLILYDLDQLSGWGHIGEIHARMLANLLGHFPLSYTMKPVDDYVFGEVQDYRTTFYLGSLYGRDLPPAFVSDVQETTSTVCWFKYNWELIESSFLLVKGNGTIQYNGRKFTKHPADLELGSSICDPAVCEVKAWASLPGSQVPYILKKENLWYVADLPFSYISEQDRYLVFADLLHNIVGIEHYVEPRALLRIEDVDPAYPPNLLKEIADCLFERGVPFAVSVIPVHFDPLGHFNSGVPVKYTMSDPKNQDFVDALRYMEKKGGRIFLHGYTHQFRDAPNPWTGVTGDDFEFYLVEEDAERNLVYQGPVPEDSYRWVRNRVSLAKSELSAVGLAPTGWVTPHYTASPLDYRYFGTAFPVTIQRVLYFTGQSQLKGYADGSWRVSEFVGQFFPYVIEKDIYGQKILPENVGYFDPVHWTVERMVDIAHANQALREPWASMFFHPFFELASLEELVTGVQELGYTFVAPTSDLK